MTSHSRNVYRRQTKYTLLSLKEFDPRPTECHGTAPNLLNDFLAKVKGKGLGVSVLFDQDMRVWKNDVCTASTSFTSTETYSLPLPAEIAERVVNLTRPSH